MNLANENKEIDTEKSKAQAEKAIQLLLEALNINWKTDPNTENTPKRVARMYVDELLSGRFQPRPTATIFPNTKKVNQLYTIGPIPVVGVCSHHFLPITGNVWIGVIPDDKLLGLSKFARFADWVFSRPQIQEEATEQLADEIEESLSPKGLAIVCKASHACMSLRGVKAQNSQMVTSVMRGLLLNKKARAEFFSIINGQDYV